MPKIAALVVTFNRRKLLEKTLDLIYTQTRQLDCVVVVDNGSTDDTEDFLNAYKNKNESLEIVNTGENLGGAGGFSRGIHYIYDKFEFDWIWLMDDDAFPAKNALEKLLAFYNSQPNKLQRRIGVIQNEMITSPEEFERLVKENREPRKKMRLFGMFVGYFIKTEVVGKIGFPDKRFFLYYDDAEYTFRAKKLGYKVFTIKGSYILHRDWAKLDRIRKLFFSKPDMAAWKVYYVFRNAFLMFQNNGFVKFFLKLYFSFDLLIWKIVKPEVVPFAKKGMDDGLNGIKGRTVEPGQERLEE
ncbi:MAG: glycosyltransferase family 2 protein [Kosmotogaceae bacterium]